MADHAYTDEFGYPLTAVQALRHMRNKRKPLYIDGKPVARPAPPAEGKRLASGLVKSKPTK